MWCLHNHLSANGHCNEDELEIMALQYRPDDKAEQNNEYHVASFVAQVMDTEMDNVRQAIEQVEGSEIHAVSAQGKIVFTLEGSHQAGIGRNIDQLKYHPGLLSLAPVYHQFISEDSVPEHSDQQYGPAIRTRNSDQILEPDIRK